MLITAAPARTAAAMLRAESEHRMVNGSARLSARAFGQMPRLPMPFAGAAATAAVAVPWKSLSAWPPLVAMFEPWNSGCDTSSWESTSAIRGLVGVTAGGTWPASTTRSRQFERGESGSGACARELRRSGSA